MNPIECRGLRADQHKPSLSVALVPSEEGALIHSKAVTREEVSDFLVSFETSLLVDDFLTAYFQDLRTPLG